MCIAVKEGLQSNLAALQLGPLALNIGLWWRCTDYCLVPWQQVGLKFGFPKLLLSQTIVDITFPMGEVRAVGKSNRDFPERDLDFMVCENFIFFRPAANSLISWPDLCFIGYLQTWRTALQWLMPNMDLYSSHIFMISVLSYLETAEFRLILENWFHSLEAVKQLKWAQGINRNCEKKLWYNCLIGNIFSSLRSLMTRNQQAGAHDVSEDSLCSES